MGGVGERQTTGEAALVAAGELAGVQRHRPQLALGDPHLDAPSSQARVQRVVVAIDAQVGLLEGAPDEAAVDVGQLSGQRAHPLAHSDPGAASFAVRAPNGAIVAYLNATPRQGGETLKNWPTFRVRHDAEEGSRDIRSIAAARGLPFRSGPGSCVIDDYRTSARSYREIACLVAGAARATVVVGAVTPGRWAREAPVIERAISAFVA